MQIFARASILRHKIKAMRFLGEEIEQIQRLIKIQKETGCATCG